MLWFVGLGIDGFDSLSEKAKKIVESSDLVYLEQFTSPIPPHYLGKIKNLAAGKLKLAPRWLVEDGNEILQNAKSKVVVLLCWGDPYIATTHLELRTRAMTEKIQTNTVHASSAVTSMVGECGLHYYKMGRTVTLMSSIKPTSAYYTIYNNLVNGNHTAILLEYDADRGFFFDPVEALATLLREEDEQARKIVTAETYVIIASRIGMEDQKITAGCVRSLLGMNFANPPHSIIIPASFHFTESDALRLLATCLDEPQNNSEKISKISAQMVKKYIPMVKQALVKIAPYYKDKGEFASVFENAELYIKDAERFFEEGKDELAILSIGYADGLVDALRMAKGIEPELNS